MSYGFRKKFRMILKKDKMEKRTKLLMVLLVSVFVFLGYRIYNGAITQTVYKSDVEYVIGVSQANMREAWRVALINEIQEEAGKYPNIRIVTADATSSVEKQEKDVDRLLDFGIDLLIISPCDSSRLTKKVRDVYLEGVPVIVMDRSVEGFDYNLFIGPDNNLIGKQGGECAAQLLGNGKGKILELRATAGSLQSEERSDGFDSVIRDYPDIEKTVCDLKNDMKDPAYDAVFAMREELKGVSLIFANNDSVAFGAYEALKDRNLAEKIKVIGCDGFTGENEGVDLVRKGKLAATISCPTGGKEAVQYAINILRKESGVPKQVILRSHTIYPKNASEYLAALDRESIDDGRRITVGYSQVGQESQWRLANTRSIQEAAREFNMELLFDSADQSQNKQIEAIRRFIKEKVDVIVVSPVVETGWDAVLKEAKEANIPVVMSDRRIEAGDDLTTTYIGADFLEEGRRAMRWLKEHVKPEHGIVHILELQGSEGATPTEERKKGFFEILEENPQYQIVYTDYGDFTFEGGKQVVEEYIKSHTWDVDIIYSHNDDMALGAIKALEAHGLKPGKDITIVSVDATKEAFQAMIDGKLNCAVECSPLLGPPLMKAIRDMIAGKEMPLRIITEEKVYDQSDAETVIKTREY